MFAWVKKLMLSKYLHSMIRHGLTAVAGILVAKGWIDADESTVWVTQNTEIITGVIMLLVGLGLSFAEKKRKTKVG